MQKALPEQDDVAFGFIGYVPVMHLLLANEENRGSVYRIRSMVDGMRAVAFRQVNYLRIVLVLVWPGFPDVFAKRSRFEQFRRFNFVFNGDVFQRWGGNVLLDIRRVLRLRALKVASLRQLPNRAAGVSSAVLGPVRQIPFSSLVYSPTLNARVPFLCNLKWL